jgi:hypothetical protein
VSKTAVLALAVAVFVAVTAISSIFVDARRGATEPGDDAAGPAQAAPRGGDDAVRVRVPTGATDRLAVREMSQTFRHSTFLIAIRGAGFVCDDVVAAQEVEGGVWAATCRDMQGYKVSVERRDELHVEPMPHYVDAAF